MKRIGFWRSASVSAFLSFLFFAVPVLSADQVIQFNVPEQSATTGIPEFARQAGIQILVSESLVRTKQTAAVSGAHTIESALRILLRGTGLVAATKDGATFTLRPADQVPTGRTSEDVPMVPGSSQSELAAQPEPLSEILVTGTLLHDVAPITPVVTITHDDIINQGYSTLAQVIEQLPMNFKAGASPESNPINGIGNNAAYNETFASGVNLRGLGAAATLVLLNGKRLAPTAFGGTVDVSQIPVSIIDHVEILSDGASSLYGSDAVAGVVNIITKRDFSGVELGGRVNSISSGKTPNYGGNALGGFSWSSGNLVMSFDYEKDNPLLANKRAVTETLLDPSWLLPRTEALSYYVALQSEFSDQLSLAVDGLVTRKKFFTLNQTTEPIPLSEYGNVSQYSLSTELQYKFSTNWTGVLIGQASREVDVGWGLFPSEPYGSVDNPVQFQVISVEPRVDGPVFRAPGGDARLAIGGQFRREWFQNTYENGSSAPPFPITSQVENSRHIASAYGEFLIPLIGDENPMRFARSLRLDISGRYDDYSDFGRTSNPKVAIEWAPIAGLALHGSYSQSFQAPSLYASSDAINVAVVVEATDPSSPTGKTVGAVVDGTNPNLKPETAKSFTVGLKYEPTQLPGLKVDTSFFSIDFDNQINRLTAGGTFGYFNWIQQAAALGSLVNLDPTIADVNQALNGRQYVLNGPAHYCHAGVGTCPLVDPSTVKAVAYLGYENSSSVRVRGIDLHANYVGEESRFGRFRSDIEGTFFTSFEQKIAPGSAEQNPLNTVNNPLRFRLKANAGWNQAHWGANARVNYAPAYDNTLDVACASTETCKISSWTTFDLSFSYLSAQSEGIRIGLDITNLFNRGAPFVSGGFTTNGIYPYDPTNANPFGRTIGVNVTKRWGGK